jgi:hypothetical protein
MSEYKDFREIAYCGGKSIFHILIYVATSPTPAARPMEIGIVLVMLSRLRPARPCGHNRLRCKLDVFGSSAKSCRYALADVPCIFW